MKWSEAINIDQRYVEFQWNGKYLISHTKDKIKHSLVKLFSNIKLMAEPLRLKIWIILSCQPRIFNLLAELTNNILYITKIKI